MSPSRSCGLDRVHAGVRLVEQQDPWLGSRRARAISSRRWSPYGRLRAGRSRCGGEPEQRQELAGPRRRARASRRAEGPGLERSVPSSERAGTCAWTPTLTLSRRSGRRTGGCSGTSARCPSRATSVRRRAGDVAPLERDRPGGRPEESRTGGGTASSCPAPFGPMTPWIDAGERRQVVVGERHEAAGATWTGPSR